MTVETSGNPTMTEQGNFEMDERPNVGSESADFDGNVDESTVKFLPEKKNEKAIGAGDVPVVVESDPVDSLEFNGMTKEELQEFSKDPFWIKVRWALFISFIVGWLAMLIAAIIIVVLAPSCPPRPDLQWWQKEVIYQIYPKSFQDSDGDGIGDIQGIISRLGYISDISTKALWLNPIYPSGGVDGGYDITNHTAIDIIYGKLDDFKMLIKTLKKKGMKLLMDFVPNHTSDKHEWFTMSRQSSSDSDKYRNYYIWHKGVGQKDPATNRTQPPNNWLSVFGGSAWTWDEKRQEYYYHQFLKEEPDLNLRNPEVQEAMKDILTFWLELGVDGFRVDAAKHLYESETLTYNNEVVTNAVSAETGTVADPNDYVSLVHNLTTDLPETYDLVFKWQALMDTYTEKTEKYRVLTTEVYSSVDKVMAYYGNNDTKGVDMPMNFNLLNLNKACDGICIKNLVDAWLLNKPKDKWANWVVGNHDNPRVATRVGRDRVNLVNMLQLLLPGTPVVYYGDEIGMVSNNNITYDQTKDQSAIKYGQTGYKKHSRDPSRTPMQWDGSANAGFSNVSSWLPVVQDYALNSVQSQESAGVGTSNLDVFKELVNLRQNASFAWGTLEWNIVNENIVSFVRQAEGFPGYLVALNVGKESLVSRSFNIDIPEMGVVAATTANFDNTDFTVGNTVHLDKLVLGPGQGVVFEFTA